MQKKEDEEKHWFVTGRINGKQYTDLLLDLGAEQMVVSSEAVPTECYTGEKKRATGMG